MPNHRARLQIVNKAGELDAVMVPKTVLFEGDEDEDLICGKCGGILGRGVTRKTAFLRFASPSGRLVIVCPSCTANNALKVTRAGP